LTWFEIYCHTNR